MDRVTIADLRLALENLMQTEPGRWGLREMRQAKAIAFDLTRFAAYFGRPATADGVWVYQSLQKLQAVLNARSPLVS